MKKVSIITAVFNRVDTVESALLSVHSQTYNNIEHIVIDGGSKDGTQELLRLHGDKISILVSERDNGIYDALNKGLSLATGDIVGFVHSDDFLADVNVITDIVKVFDDQQVDAVYGDLDYVFKNDTNRILRQWKSGDYSINNLKYGWMPPHPTLYLKRSIVTQLGGFDTGFKIAADYDAMLRYLSRGRISLGYLNRVLVKMRTGGESNRSINKIILKTQEDYRALKKNNVGGVLALLLKNFSKVKQFRISGQ